MPLFVPSTTRAGNASAEQEGLITWAFDPSVASASGNTLATGGTVYGTRLYVPQATTVTNIIYSVLTAGATLTTGQCFIGLYQNNTLLSTSADQAVPWVSTGLKTTALSAAQSVAAGYVDVALFFNGTTGPTLLKGTATANAAINIASGTGTRSFTADTGRTTTLAASLGAKTSVQPVMWFALS